MTPGTTTGRTLLPRIGAVALRAPWAVAGAALILSALVVWPMTHGQLVLLDWTMTRRVPLLERQAYGLDGGLPASVPLLTAFAVAARVAGDAASWLPIALFFPVAAVGAARAAGGGTARQAGGALLYAVNPFVFERIYAGQVNVLAAYALLPFGLRAVTQASADLRARSWLVTGSWWAAMIACSIHFVWVFGVVVGASVLRLKGLRRQLVGAALAVAVAALASAPLLVTAWGQQQAVAVGAADLAAYRTSGTHGGLFLDVLGLYGFWRPGPRLPKDVMVVWPLLLLALLVVIAAGVRRGRQDPARRRQTALLLITGSAGFVLALGDQGPTGPLFRWLYLHLPGFSVMREPGKFSALLALSYAVLFSWGIEAIFEGTRRPRLSLTAGGVALVLPFAYTPTLVNGLGGQVTASAVPRSYVVADALMGRGPESILFLPWHEYLSFPFVGRVVANPASSWFDRPVISGDDVELKNISSASTSTRSAYLGFLYSQGEHLTEFGALTAPLGIKYVVLAKTVDWQRYAWLSHQRDLRPLLDTADLVVYENTERVDVGHRVTSVATVRDWGQLIAVSRGTDVSGGGVAVQHAVPGPIIDPATLPRLGARGPALQRDSPTRYSVPSGAAGWVIVSEPFARDWRLGVHAAQPSGTGGMLFPAGRAATTVRFGHLASVVAGWAVSGSSLTAVALVLFRGRRRIRTGRPIHG